MIFRLSWSREAMASPPSGVPGEPEHPHRPLDGCQVETLGRQRQTGKEFRVGIAEPLEERVPPPELFQEGGDLVQPRQPLVEDDQFTADGVGNLEFLAGDDDHLPPPFHPGGQVLEPPQETRVVIPEKREILEEQDTGVRAIDGSCQRRRRVGALRKPDPVTGESVDTGPDQRRPGIPDAGGHLNHHLFQPAFVHRHDVDEADPAADLP